MYWRICKMTHLSFFLLDWGEGMPNYFREITDFEYPWGTREFPEVPGASKDRLRSQQMCKCRRISQKNKTIADEKNVPVFTNPCNSLLWLNSRKLEDDPTSPPGMMRRCLLWMRIPLQLQEHVGNAISTAERYSQDMLQPGYANVRVCFPRNGPNTWYPTIF